MPPTWPSIQAIYRKLERIAIGSSDTATGIPDPTKDEVRSVQTYLEQDATMANRTYLGDRTLTVPAHQGRNTFPCHPLFNRLVRFAHNRPPRLCIRDDNTGVEATHVQLLSDVLAYREHVLEHLSSKAKQALDRREEVYIAILAPGGYEFTVAILAALALGAAVVPITVALPPQEALYFIKNSRAVAMLTASSALRLGTNLEKLIKDDNPRSSFTCIPITPKPTKRPLHPTEIIVSSDTYLDDNAPGVVIHTSGTTGPPKGAVMRRGFIHDEALAVVDHYDVSKDDVLLHVLPVHHATGIGMMFFPFLIGGALQEFKSGSFDPAWTWERWKQGGTTFFSGVPTIYMRMMRHFEQHLARRPDVQAYIDGARGLRACICGTSALPKPIADWWFGLLGQHILLRYGMTETGAVFKVHLNDQNVPDGSVGNVFAGVDIRLSEGKEGDGDVGQILAKSPGMFSKFLFDPEATAASHTADGYYKTGDIAREEGGYYFIMGRASVDIIKSGGYKISALDIEREILALPYVQEVMVVGVADAEFGERVAAAICLKNREDMPSGQSEVKQLSIKELRQDLRERLAGYKLPTVLRVLPTELPKSGTGKVVKKLLGPTFFPHESYKDMPEVEVWNRQDQSKL